MDRDPNLEGPNRFPQTYGNLVNLWTSAVRDYHSLLSDYLMANSIFVAAIGYILARQPPTFLFTCLGMILCVFGILMVAQMAIVLGRFSAQIALWEWQLRGIERQTSWTQPHLFIRLQEYRDHHQSLEDHRTIHRSYARRGHSANTGNGGPVASTASPYFSGLRMSSSWSGVGFSFSGKIPRCGYDGEGYSRLSV